MENPASYDIAISGAGIIGLTLALELNVRGARIALLDTGQATRGASTAAAGMLAADDPHNPASLHALSSYSVGLYGRFLAQLTELGGMPVPFQTDRTMQYIEDGSTLGLAEHSVDPRQLAGAALAAVRKTKITLLENCGGIQLAEKDQSVRVDAEAGFGLNADRVIHASGAWFSRSNFAASFASGRALVSPRKGQMLRLRIPKDLPLGVVHRSADVYIVPRTQGPQAGTAVVGATDEDSGFNLSVHQPDLDHLRDLAARLVPELADPEVAPQVESWAGLRPATPDLLPLLGPLPGSARQWVATGHYRNGILLAPATAVAVSDMLEGRRPAVDLEPFSPLRFS